MVRYLASDEWFPVPITALSCVCADGRAVVDLHLPNETVGALFPLTARDELVSDVHGWLRHMAHLLGNRIGDVDGWARRMAERVADTCLQA